MVTPSEGRVVAREVSVPSPAVVQDTDTIMGLVGTMDGLRPNVLEAGTPAFYATAQQAINALTPEDTTKTPTGTIWKALFDFQRAENGPVIISGAESTDADDVDSALDAMAIPVQDRFPCLLYTSPSPRDS